MRDDFLQQTLDTLAKRVGARCSNPRCRKLTTGPRSEASRSVNIGVGAHITAAAPGGPRFDPLLTADQRRAIENGIWLCQNCAKLVDNDSTLYPAGRLREWKIGAEQAARDELEGRPAGSTTDHRQPTREERPEIRALRERLEQARERKRSMEAKGHDVAEIVKEMVEIKRALRAGGQLHQGDELGGGRYLLMCRLGEGGFATVWEAKDQTSGEHIAIKVLHPHRARDESQRDRFFRGARKMAEVAHPGVVRVLECHGEDDGWLYFVMELVTGRNFHQAVLEGQLDSWRVLEIIGRVGNALVAAHTKNLLHRDVKPANILLDRSGAPRLTDFDLVAARDTTGGTEIGEGMGTILYAAPEALVQAGEADARADVYSLGMTALFGLYGRELPREMRDFDTLIDGLACNEKVKAVLKTATAGDREDRFPNMIAFCGALHEALAMARIEDNHAPLVPHVVAALLLIVSSATIFAREARAWLLDPHDRFAGVVALCICIAPMILAGELLAMAVAGREGHVAKYSRNRLVNPVIVAAWTTMGLWSAYFALENVRRGNHGPWVLRTAGMASIVSASILYLWKQKRRRALRKWRFVVSAYLMLSAPRCVFFLLDYGSMGWGEGVFLMTWGTLLLLDGTAFWLDPMRSSQGVEALHPTDT